MESQYPGVWLTFSAECSRIWANREESEGGESAARHCDRGGRGVSACLMEENMANILVSGLINTETTVRVRQFPVNYYPIDYPFFGVNI